MKILCLKYPEKISLFADQIKFIKNKIKKIMYNVILFLIIFLSFLLVLVIMVQNPKGGGLASTFGGDSQQIGGVKKTTDFLDKSTWILSFSTIF